MKLIKILVTVLILLSVCSCASSEKNAFRSVTVGLEVTKPSEWTFVTADENRENIKKIRLNDEEFQKKFLMMKNSRKNYRNIQILL